MSGRIASAVLVDALRRRAEQEGGAGMVLAKGDAAAGAVIVVLMERGVALCAVERLLAPDGRYRWQRIAEGERGNRFDPEKFLEKRRRFDPDLWIIELDIPSAERFTAEMNAVD